MAGKDIIMASAEEIKRIHVVKKVLEGGLKQVEASDMLSLSGRQVRRLVKRVRDYGEMAQNLTKRSIGRAKKLHVG